MEPRTEKAPAPSSLPPVPEKADLGQILVRDGLLRPEQLEDALRTQREMVGREGTPPPRLGEILVRKGYVTREAVERALGEQDKKILFCPSCEILVNVDRRPDAIAYQCGRCQGPLRPPPPGDGHKCVESSIIVNSCLPVPPEVQEALRETTRRFGKYVILEPLGRGGIAEVSRAWDTYLHQYVALKRIKPQPSETASGHHSRVASLLNEAHNAIRLRHPNIVSVYDIGRVGQVYYISMECLEGHTLYDEIRRHREQRKQSLWDADPERWLGVLYQVAHAVHYAHTRPIPTFHCDLKPGNIFIAKDGRPYVLDFGLARQLGNFADDVGMISGTPSYMSPEQAAGRNDEVDARTDVYGLGAVLYEVLTGRPPFAGDMGKVILQTLRDRPVPPSTVARERAAAGERTRSIPADLEALCLRCLEKERERRPPSALAVAQEIASILQKARAVLDGSASSSRTRAVSLPPPRSRRAAPAAAALAAAVLTGAAAWVAFRPAPETEPPAERALRRLAEFRPEAPEALGLGSPSEPGPARLARHRDAVLAFKERLSDAVRRLRPVLPELSVRGRTLRDVRIFKAYPDRVVFLAEDEPDAADWSDLGPEGVAALAAACGLLDRAEDRWGLALYCRAAGRDPKAAEILRTLEGTPLAEEARRELEEIRRP
ncbi:MAG TPA: protein kinase [Planctomycetota bacterium]|nr:protein kinase [Planctomycetota bacterium]